MHFHASFTFHQGMFSRRRSVLLEMLHSQHRELLFSISKKPLNLGSLTDGKLKSKCGRVK